VTKTLKSTLQNEIASVFSVPVDDIAGWRKLSTSDNTNSVYSFRVNGEKYVIRSGDQDADHVLNERAAYEALKGLRVTDELVYLSDDGIKIARFLDGTALGFSDKDRKDVVDVLRTVHQSGAKIPRKYKMFDSIKYYTDRFPVTKNTAIRIFEGFNDDIVSIRAALDKIDAALVLCHCDACVTGHKGLPGNFIRLKDGSVRLIDWEEPAMADPFLDFAIASCNQTVDEVAPDWCVEQYLGRKPDAAETYRLHAYITLVALMDAAWAICEAPEDFQAYIKIARRFNPVRTHTQSFSAALSLHDRPAGV